MLLPPPLYLGMVCLPLQFPAVAPPHSLDFGGVRQRGKRVWSLCLSVVTALYRGACSPLNPESVHQGGSLQLDPATTPVLSLWGGSYARAPAQVLWQPIRVFVF